MRSAIEKSRDEEDSSSVTIMTSERDKSREPEGLRYSRILHGQLSIGSQKNIQVLEKKAKLQTPDPCHISI